MRRNTWDTYMEEGMFIPGDIFVQDATVIVTDTRRPRRIRYSLLNIILDKVLPTFMMSAVYLA